MSARPTALRLKARVRRCAACRQVKPLIEYSNPGHRMCSRCQPRGETDRRQPADRRRARTGPLPARISNARSTGIYNGAELRPFADRPGAMVAFDCPSRVGALRIYRDGRTEGVA